MSRLTGVLAGIPCGRVSKWVTLVLWIGVTAALIPFFGRLDEVRETGPTAELPRGAESAAVYIQLEKFRSVVDQVPAVVVYTRESGITAADRAKVEADRARFAKYVARGEQVSPTIPSEDGKALMFVVPLPRDEGVEWPVRDMRAESAVDRPAGLDVAFGGPGAMLNDYGMAFENLDENLMVAAGSVVILLLLLIYRSPTLWLIPVISAGFAAALTQGVTYLAGKYASLPVNPASASILMVLVFGVGTDYALLLIARFREELRNEADRHAAMRAALRRSGAAITASAATVVAGLICLALADMESSRSLGLVGAVGVACAYIAMVTILPALLVIVGRWVFWPFIPRVGQDVPVAKGRLWAGIGNFVGRHARVTWLACLVVVGGLATGAYGMDMGLSQSEVFQSKPEAVVAQEKLSRHFPSGASDPAMVIAAAGSADQVRAAARNVSGVQDVSEPIRSTDGRLVLMDVIFKDPPESAAAMATVDRLRAAVHAVPGAGAIVGGTTADTLDKDRASDRDIRVIIPIVLLVILLVLIVLLRALVAPVVLLVTVAVSFLAALGGSNLLFEHVFGHAGVSWTLPLVSFVFLVALGVDYNIFLMTRVREEVAKRGHSEGVKHGLWATGGVITSAGIVLAATFVTFITMPVVDMVQFGVVVALGVLIDTFLVRTLMVPALSLDIGRAVWWPSKLAADRGVAVPSEAVGSPESAPRR